MIKPSAMPKFSCMKQPGGTLGAQPDLRLEPLAAALDHPHRGQVVGGDGRVVDPPDQQRGHQVDVRHPVPLDQLEDVSDRVLVPSTTVPPRSRKPCRPGQPSGRLCSIGSTSSSTSPSPISQTAAAIVELYR